VVNALDFPEVGRPQLCYAGRCPSKIPPPAALKARRTPRRASSFIAAERTAMKNHLAPDTAAAQGNAPTADAWILLFAVSAKSKTTNYFFAIFAALR